MPNNMFEFKNGPSYVHSKGRCAGEFCVIHNPSDHAMKDWPMIMRESALVERECRHGVGHPDPDSLKFFLDLYGKDRNYMGVHGCDGCCFGTQAEARATTGVIEKITWIDSGMQLDEGWAPTSVYIESANKWNGEVVTLGTVFHEDDKVVVVGLSRDSQVGNWFGAQLIFKKCITGRELYSAANADCDVCGKPNATRRDGTVMICEDAIKCMTRAGRGV